MASAPLPPLLSAHLRAVQTAYERPTRPGFGARLYRRELARQLRYLIPPDASVLEIGCGSGDLLALLPNRDVAGIDLAAGPLAVARERLPFGTFWQQAGEELEAKRAFDVIIVSDTLNLAADVQLLLSRLHRAAHPGTRLIVNFQNNLWHPLLAAASALGLRDERVASSWLSSSDVAELCELSDWRRIRRSAAILCPIPLLGLDRLINRYLAPLVPGLNLAMFSIGGAGCPQPAHSVGPSAGQSAEGALRRVEGNSPHPCVSVIVPVRNEAGTIEELIRRTPRMGRETELIFVEGGSTDDSWNVLTQVATAHTEGRIRVLRQSGTGKANAVREGFAAARGDILMILDADLSVPPEDLPKFYEALVSGRAEFGNGSRLVYPVGKEAMRFPNMCANQLFALGFRWLLGQRVKDTLCGTKALWRADYERIAAQRAYFGEFDPFGDFDLLFGASKLSLKILDIPVRYQERTYGETNIRRWRHGWLLLRMTGFAAARMKFF